MQERQQPIRGAVDLKNSWSTLKKVSTDLPSVIVGKGVSSMGLPWERNWDELCDRFCLAFLTDFRENPSTLSTDGDVVAAEDIALLGRHMGGGIRQVFRQRHIHRGVVLSDVHAAGGDGDEQKPLRKSSVKRCTQVRVEETRLSAALSVSSLTTTAANHPTGRIFCRATSRRLMAKNTSAEPQHTRESGGRSGVWRPAAALPCLLHKRPDDIQMGSGRVGLKREEGGRREEEEEVGADSGESDRKGGRGSEDRKSTNRS
ncbi:hypothetical protein EYF80_030392 [Liparis tanakae]|uniref:Uncharacterized protein n=1 Tax=Liparis tanakae TaxID=230148 RepID=A0A4Z2H0J1_9TELE|nr:hypothetical protein EYF80_030392 [Liparis tanakae]